MLQFGPTRTSGWMLGEITERTAGHMFGALVEQEAPMWLCDTSVDLRKRVERLAEFVHRQHRERANNFGRTAREEQAHLMVQTSRRAMHVWFDTFYDKAWPSYLGYISTKLMQTTKDPGGHCKNCGHDWKRIGCAQHVLFQSLSM
jgi:hypothetical protein